MNDRIDRLVEALKDDLSGCRCSDCDPGGEKEDGKIRTFALAVWNEAIEEAAREAYWCREKVAPIIHATPVQMAEHIMQLIRALKEEKK